jgi:hypothetical protein
MLGPQHGVRIYSFLSELKAGLSSQCVWAIRRRRNLTEAEQRAVKVNWFCLKSGRFQIVAIARDMLSIGTTPLETRMV